MKMKQDLEIIKDLMDELIADMEPGEEDFAERLGRKKPEVAMIKMEVEGESGEPGQEIAEEEEEMHPFEMGYDPADSLRNRIKKLRG